MYSSTKTYGHDVGLSCCFRQHRATHSHCSKLHGYSIAVKLTFTSECLNELNWVMDFGGLKAVKQFLVDTFDHKLLLAEDDLLVINNANTGTTEPSALEMLHQIADVVILPAVGCESFASYIFHWVSTWLQDSGLSTVRLESVEVSEHGANSAIYRE